MLVAFWVTTFALGTVVCCILYATQLQWSKRQNLPPGPPRVPLLGNIHQLPQSYQYKFFVQWAERYGDVVYAEFFTRSTIVVSSVKAACDLMEKRSAKFSERPRFVRIREMIGWTGNIGWRPYDDTWKRQRRWFQQLLISASALKSHRPLQEHEVRRLLYDVVQHPADFISHIKRYAASLILEIGYGHTVTSVEGDEFIQLVEAGIHEVFGGSGAGSALVDFFPTLKYIPAWLPGAGFKRAALMAKEAIAATEDIPYKSVKDAMAAGVAKPCFTTAMIQDCLKKGALTFEDEDDIKGTAATLYAGGTDPIVTTITVFVLAMVQHPDVFRKAQEEVIQVVGEERLPEFSDRTSMPYLENVLREVYRWRPAVPTAAPHMSSEDDVYRGYYIPKGSMIIPNLWAMFHDPEVYQEPETFNPERFSGMNVDRYDDPRRIVFGFGRRACPGRYFADNSVWILAASLLATMDVRKARNARGEEIAASPKFHGGTVIRPEPFVCDIHPRSEKSRELILAGKDIVTAQL
ncbi:hypothetical protein EVJ58_g3137 [Rhodofomes roseus]|uniref:Cytochrome P450 n=1 Tax=Rhodofomes roseus TaxID=34475 RepID=A0A4Y9YMB7_9APHY|nr:hypothetical protein EVJ58_g3137 [Rhodofomes roseus]